MSITYFKCMFVALGIQHVMRMRRIVICDLPPTPLYIIFTHFLINGAIFENKLRQTKYFLILSTAFEIFLILSTNERDMMKSYVSLHVTYPLFLSNFNET